MLSISYRNPIELNRSFSTKRVGDYVKLIGDIQFTSRQKVAIGMMVRRRAKTLVTFSDTCLSYV